MWNNVSFCLSLLTDDSEMCFSEIPKNTHTFIRTGGGKDSVAQQLNAYILELKKYRYYVNLHASVGSFHQIFNQTGREDHY